MVFEKTVDYGNTPEFYVDGISAIEHYANVVRLEYFATYRAIDGSPEQRLVLMIRWPMDAWMNTTVFRASKAVIRGTCPTVKLLQ